MSERESAQFRATADAQQGFGETPQKALEALLSLLPNDLPSPIIIWPYNRGDAFFTEAQQARLEELKGQCGALTDTEREELEQLVEASFDATIARTKALPLVKS